MLDFNSYINGLFGRNASSGETRNRLEAVIDTLTKQLALLGGKNSLKPSFTPNPYKPGGADMVPVDASSIMDGKKLLTGAEFDRGMDRLTGQVLVQAQFQNTFGREASGLTSAAQYLFSAEATRIAAEAISGQWKGFSKCVAKAMQISPPQDSTAIAEAMELIKGGAPVNGVARLYQNWRQGGQAAANSGIPESLMKGIEEQMIPRRGEKLSTAAKRAEEWLKAALQEMMPPPEKGEDEKDEKPGEEQEQDGDQPGEGQDGEGKDGEGQDGEGQDGEGEGSEGDRLAAFVESLLGESSEGEDGEGEGSEGKDGEGKDGEGQDGEGKDGEGQDGEGKPSEGKPGKTLAEHLAELAKKSNANREAKTGSLDPTEKILNPDRIDGVRLKDLEDKKDYKIETSTLRRAERAGLNIRTNWLTIEKFITPSGWVDSRQLYRQHRAGEKAATTRVADAIHFPCRDTAADEYGMRSGSLDEGNLWQLSAGISHRVFSRSEIISKPKALIVILLDMSGSMGCGNKIVEAAMICRLIIEAWQILRIDGAELCVYGHTAELDGDSLDMVKIFDRTYDGREGLSNQLRHSNMYQNLDGYAIHACLTEAWRVNPDIKPTETSLIVVSDGEPAGGTVGYDCKRYGIAHTSYAIRTHRSAGVQIDGIGIENAFSPEKGDAIYGIGHCTILNDTLSGLSLLTKRIRKICDR
jgi:hypothetical protein